MTNIESTTRTEKQATNYTPEQAYEIAARAAADAGLIVSASGGVVTFAHPDTLKEAGVWCKSQHMAGLGPFPGQDTCECVRSGKGSCLAKTIPPAA
jgi:hypothetical protein